MNEQVKNYREYRTVEKDEWGPGPWMDEPDKVQWIDPETDLDCLIVRSCFLGALCGYVGVTSEHPLYGVAYNQEVELLGAQLEKRKNLPIGAMPSFSLMLACLRGELKRTPNTVFDVHGGITFSEQCQPNGDEGRGICHVSAKGRPDHVWWFGFDCGHDGDRSPKRTEWTDGEYRDIAYVTGQVTKLAAQLKEVAS